MRKVTKKPKNLNRCQNLRFGPKITPPRAIAFPELIVVAATIDAQNRTLLDVIAILVSSRRIYLKFTFIRIQSTFMVGRKFPLFRKLNLN